MCCVHVVQDQYYISKIHQQNNHNFAFKETTSLGTIDLLLNKFKTLKVVFFLKLIHSIFYDCDRNLIWHTYIKPKNI